MARMRGCIWLAAGLVVALLAGVIAFVTLTRATARPAAGPAVAGPAVKVLVAAGSVPVRTVLTAELVQVREMPVEAAPQGYLSDPAQAVGKITTVELYPGEAILPLRLVDPNVASGDGRLALVLAADEVLMAFPADDLLSRVGVLKPGDRVDILVSLDFPTERAAGAEGGTAEQATFNVLQNVAIAAVVGGAAPQAAGGNALTGGGTAPAGTAPQALLLTVSPQNALILKYVRDAGGRVDLVLRAPGVDQTFEVDPVDLDLMIQRSRIPIEVGR